MARVVGVRELRYLAIALSVLMLAACTSDFQRAGYDAVKADCRLQGYLPGTLDYRDCVKVGNHQIDVADMQQRLFMMQQYQALGSAWAPQPSPSYQLPAPTVANPQTFCYPGAGYMYCQ